MFLTCVYVVRIIVPMPTLGNEPLGIVEEAQRRREQYARYIERRVEAELRRPPTRREIERRVAEQVRQRVDIEVRRLAARRAAARLKEVERLMPLGLRSATFCERLLPRLGLINAFGHAFICSSLVFLLFDPIGRPDFATTF